MRRLTQHPFTLLLLLLFSMQACKNYEDFPEVDEVDYKAEWVAPLFSGTIDVRDLIEDAAEDLQEVQIQPDGSILFSYEADAMEQDVASFLEPFPDFPVATNQPSLSIPFNIIPDYQVNSMVLKSGTLSFTVNNAQTPEDVNVMVRFPDLVRNGQMFSVSTFLDYNGSMPVRATIPAVDLSGYVMELDDGTLTIEYIATNTQGDPVDITLVTGEAQDWTPSQVTGVWRREVVEVDQDTIEIDLFNEDYIEGDVTFTDPQFTLMVDNSFGLPTRVVIRSLNVITVDNQVLSLEGSVVSNGFNINYPSIDEIGTSKQTVFTFNKDNSNIDDILNSRPKQMIFVIDAVINPENSTELGYLNEQSKITIGVRAELSAEGTASNFAIEEPFDVEIEEDEAEHIDFIELKLNARNGIPLSSTTQFYFMNTAGEKIDSLFAEGPKTILAAASETSNGTASQSPEQITRVTLTRSQIDHLITMPEMLSATSISTTNNGNTPVSFNADQELQLDLGIRLKLQ